MIIFAKGFCILDGIRSLNFYASIFPLTERFRWLSKTRWGIFAAQKFKLDLLKMILFNCLRSDLNYNVTHLRVRLVQVLIIKLIWICFSIQPMFSPCPHQVDLLRKRTFDKEIYHCSCLNLWCWACFWKCLKSKKYFACFITLLKALFMPFSWSTMTATLWTSFLSISAKDVIKSSHILSPSRPTRCLK